MDSSRFQRESWKEFKSYHPELAAATFEDDLDEEPLENGWGSYGDFQLVGNGEVTNVFCGKFMSYKGCLRVDLHNLITLDGMNYSGKVFVRKVHHWCNKPSCPICFKSGWAVREAGNIEGRLAEASKRFGLVEHIVCSVPLRDYGLSFEDLRSSAVKALFVRGVVGGVLIFHGFRYNLSKHWYWSLHFHVLGFVLGGYRCRGCKRKNNCFKGCGGFDDRSYQNFLKDGYVVKVLGERKTVFGTAWYQLNHASIKRGVKRFHVATWFGVCSYRKLKVTVERKKDLCPICGEELVKLRYLGVKPIVKVRGDCGYVSSFFDDLVDVDGSVNWYEAPNGSYGSFGSSSYEY